MRYSLAGRYTDGYGYDRPRFIQRPDYPAQSHEESETIEIIVPQSKVLVVEYNHTAKESEHVSHTHHECLNTGSVSVGKQL